jgi:hypothetical protein
MIPNRRKLYHVRELNTPGMVRTVFRSTDSVIVEKTRDGRPAGDFRFARGAELQLLSDALEVAISSRDVKARNIGAFCVPSGAVVEVGAYAGVLLLRWRLPGGEPRSSTLIRGSELVALRQAVDDLKERNAS